jgi:hypothetical protein
MWYPKYRGDTMKNEFGYVNNHVVIKSVCRGERVNILVDYDTFEKLKFYKGTVHVTKAKSGIMYAYLQWQVKKKRLTIQLHHVVMGKPDKGYVVDHKNRNGLDDRRCNLHIIPEMNNHWNVSLEGREQNGNHSTGHLHISYVNFKGKMVYRVRISRDYKDYHIGHFDNLDEAINERDIALDKLNEGVYPSKKTSSGVKHIVKARNGWRFAINKKDEKFTSGLFRTIEEAIEFKEQYFRYKEQEVTE